MTDTPPPAAPEPTPSYVPTPGTAAPVGAAAPKTLSIISLVAGIVGILGAAISFIPIVGSILGLFIPAAAVILGLVARRKEPLAPRAFWLVGIILGAIALLIAIIALIAWIAFIAANQSAINSYNNG